MANKMVKVAGKTYELMKKGSKAGKAAAEAVKNLRDKNKPKEMPKLKKIKPRGTYGY